MLRGFPALGLIWAFRTLRNAWRFCLCSQVNSSGLWEWGPDILYNRDGQYYPVFMSGAGLV